LLEGIAMVTIIRDSEIVTSALAAGQVSVTDQTTGLKRSMHADCPGDGHAAGPWRVVKGGGGAITEIVMRCAQCGEEFVPSVAEIYLR
jgi:hypothetical protein